MPERLSQAAAGVMDRALQRLLVEIREGLRHGYFEYTVSCEVIGAGRRRLLLRVGKNYQFVIPAEECEATGQSSDLRHEGAMNSRS